MIPESFWPNERPVIVLYNEYSSLFISEYESFMSSLKVSLCDPGLTSVELRVKDSVINKS